MTNDPSVPWQCDKCGEEIVGSTGYLSVDMPAVNLAERVWQGRETEAVQPSPTDLSIAEGRQPQKVHWRVHHIACSPDSGSMSFGIDAAEIATLSRVLAWTLHFMDSKNWIRHTDWTSFVRARTGVDLRKERT